MKNWFYSLTPHEQRWVVGGGIVLGIFLAYAMIWAPLTTHLDRLEKTVNEQRALHLWMQQAELEAKQLRTSSQPAASANTSTSVLAVVDQAAKQAQLGNAVKRVQPEGQDTVRVNLDQASFDDVVRWLDSLVRNYGVGIVDISIDRQDAAGHVNVRVTLKRAA